MTLAAVDEFAVSRVAAELIRRTSEDIEFVVISQRLAGDFRERVEWRQVRLPRRLPFRLRYPLFVLWASLSLRRAHARLRHTFGAYPLVLQRVDLATVHFSHTAHYRLAPEQDSRPVRMFTEALERWCYRPGRVRLLAAPSAAAKRELERHFPGIDVVVTPNGVDTDRFRPDGGTRRAVRLSEGVASNETVAVFVGRAWHGKGVDIALRAVAEARAGGADIRLWIVGEQTQDTLTLAAELPLGEWVRFFGRRSDVERFLQAADVFVFPSLTEGFPLACLEAAAAGLPIVATAVGGVEELLAQAEAGWIVERSPGAFAQALTRLASDPNLRARMGAAARERAMVFGWDRAAEALVGTYRRLLDPDGAESRTGM